MNATFNATQTDDRPSQDIPTPIRIVKHPLTVEAIGTHTAHISAVKAPEPLRVIRKIDGRHQWVTLASVDELTEDECRSIYTAAFGIYA